MNAGSAKYTHEQSLLQRAATEINQLRQKNLIQATRLQMFDDMKMILLSQVPSQGMVSTPDLLSEIENHFKELENNS